MAYKEIFSTSTKQFVGLSTDTKPTANIPTGSTYYESDKADVWTYDELNINPATTNGWWFSYYA